MNVIVAAYVSGARLFAFELTVNVIVVADVVAVPDVDDAVSQFGKFDIAKSTLPMDDAS